MAEVLYDEVYGEDGIYNHFRVEKETTPENIIINIYQIRKNESRKVCTTTYMNIGEEYIHPFLSWYNLIFCSNYYGAAPNYDYMKYAVQQNKKPVASLLLQYNSKEAMRIRENLPSIIGAMQSSNCENIMYLYRNGCLADYFDFEQIKKTYSLHEIYGIDWDKIEYYFTKPLSYFCDTEKSGFNLQAGNGPDNISAKEKDILIGLVLGYPIESTIAFINDI